MMELLRCRKFIAHPITHKTMLRAGLISILALFTSPLFAATAQMLTMDQALETAFANNPDLAAAQWETGIAQGERQQAGLIPNPEVSWEAEDTRRNSRTTTVMINQPIELGGKRGARIDVASRAQDAAGIELERKRNVLRADVIQAFYNSTTAQQRLLLARQSLELAERGLRVARGRIDSGKSSPVEGTRAQVQLSQVRLELRRAERDEANSYQQLAQVMGAPLPAFASVGDSGRSMPTVPDPSLLLNRIGETAELRLAKLQIDQREASLGLEKAQRIPDLTVSVGSQYDERERERVNVVGLSMPIPLFNRNQGNVLAAARRTDQARDLRNASELLAVMERYPAVRVVLGGHVHQAFERRHGHVLVLATPSTCAQFTPLTEHCVMDLRPPGYRWLELLPDGQVRTEVRWLQDWEVAERPPDDRF